MKLTADYHTHTVFSHGTGTVTDNVEAAVKLGLTEVGITDHGTANLAYGIKRGRLKEYIDTIEAAGEQFADKIRVKKGIELNLTGLDGSADIPQGFAFDILILGYHKSALTRDIKTMWAFIAGKSHKQAITNAYMLAIQKHRINIVSHPGYGVPVDFRMLGRACADYGALFEINEKHTELTAEDIQAAASEGARFVISSDAHRPQDVGKTPRAIELAGDAGINIKQLANIGEGKA